MMRRTLKLAWFKRNRYALTVVAIALSVAFIVSTLLLTTSIADVGQPLRQGYERVDVVVTGAEVAVGDGPDQAITAPVPRQTMDDLVAAGFDAVGFSDPYAQVIASDGQAGGQDQTSANVAEPWLADSPLNAFTITDGRAPASPGEAALDRSTADAAGLDVGDPLRFVTDDGAETTTLVGLATFGGSDNDPYTSTLLLSPDHPVFTGVDGFDRVLVARAEVDDVAALAPGQTVRSGGEWILAEENALNDFLGFFSTFLTVFAVVAVVVGMVIVTNTFTVSLAQRTQELALLRLVGTTRRQLLIQVVLEAFLLGAVGTALGLALGIAGVSALGWFLDVLGLVIERSSGLSSSALVIGIVVGVGVTVVAAVRPAWKATAVAPIEALRANESEQTVGGARRFVAGGTFIAGLVLLAWGVIATDILITGIAIGALFLALYLGADSLVRIAARIARPVMGTAGPTGTIASRNLERNAGRTSAAASALMIGIALIGFFTLMAATIGEFIAGDAGEALEADLVVQGIGSRPEPALGDDLLAAIGSVDGLEVVVPLYQTSVTPVAGATVERIGPGGDGALGVAIADVDALRSTFAFEVNAGSLDDIAGTAVAIDQATADTFDLTVGDPLEVTALAGDITVTVATIVETSLPGAPQPAVVGDLGLRAVVGLDDPATIAYVGGSAAAADVRAVIDLPTVEVVSRDDYIDGLGSRLGTILALVYALLAVAVVVALIGIANTVSLAISERVGEIAATRAAGASIRQIFWSLLAEFGLLAIVGIASGLAFAWVAAAAFFNTLSGGQIGTPTVDVATGVLIVAGGLAGALAASWLPARSASRADILDALRAD